jgi:simple sugar transport system substrate-binding protein
VYQVDVIVFVPIVEIRGTEGSSPAVGRTAGFREILASDKAFKIVSSVSGDFLRSLGREAIAHELDIGSRSDIIFSYNDGMPLLLLPREEQIFQSVQSSQSPLRSFPV